MIVDHIQVRETVSFDDSAQVRIVGDGYLVAAPRVARTGIQVYGGREMGRPEMRTVNVYRPEAEVFHKDAAASLAHRPVTNDHPTEAVTAENWRKHAVGQTDGEVMRDGEFLRVPMVVMDGGAIADIKAGKRELSLGYGADIVWGEGVTPDGQHYDATQTNIRINHLAIVDAARGGPKLAIGDAHVKLTADHVVPVQALIAQGKVDTTSAWSITDSESAVLLGKFPVGKAGKVFLSGLNAAKTLASDQGLSDVTEACDSLLALIATKANRKVNTMEKTIIVDGLPVTLSEQAAAIVSKTLATLEQAVKDSATAKATAEAASAEASAAAAKAASESKATIDALTAERDTLKTERDAAVAEMNDTAKQEAKAAERVTVVAKAKALIGDKFVEADGKLPTAELIAKAVAARLGETSKGYDAAMNRVAFDTLTVDVKVEGVSAVDQMRASVAAVKPGFISTTSDSQKAYDKRTQDAWKTAGEVK